MKPSANRFYCPGAAKHKILFSSEAKARNFIRFNADEFTARGATPPIRAYYCILCIGWHVTATPLSEARFMDIHDRVLLHWLLAIASAFKMIELIRKASDTI